MMLAARPGHASAQAYCACADILAEKLACQARYRDAARHSSWRYQITAICVLSLRKYEVEAPMQSRAGLRGADVISMLIASPYAQ